MKTAIVGGGKGCRSLLEFILERGLTELRLDVVLVCDLRSHAPGILYAADHGIRTCSLLENVFHVQDIELIVELTGDDHTAEEIYHRMPSGVGMMDHKMARVFWDLIQLERNLRTERQQVQDILDSMPDIVLVLDPEMRIQTVNAGFTRFTGIPRSDARGQKCHQALCRREGKPLGSDHICPFDEVIESGERVSLVQVRECVPGHEEHFEITMTPIWDRDGKVVRVVEALHPINERVRLSREVELAARRFQHFIESANDLISIKDPEGRYQVVNSATARLFGKKPEECLGKTVHELYPIDIAKLVSSHDREVIRRGEAIQFEETLLIGSKEHHLSTLRYPMRDYNRDVVGVCTISRDVTEERRLQNQLVQADKLAAIGKLAAGVAHEINNPLTGILAYAEDLLEDAEEGDERIEDYQVIVRETLRCREIVRNLLDFAKQARPQFGVAELNDVVERTNALVSRLAIFRDIDLEMRLSREPVSVVGDAHQLQQVVLNLMVNAAEGMTGKGRIEIETGRLPGGRSGHVTVSDDGPGIPESAKGRIFEPFFSTKQKTHGLGLAVSWGIVERHGGRIEAENRDEGGARFRVSLPIAEV